MSPHEVPELRDAKYVGQRIKKSVRWLREEARLGRIECTRIGRSLWWTDAQIAKIISDAARKATQEREATPTKAARSAPAPKRREPAPPRKPTNTKTGIPQADFTVSRLYKQGAA